MSRQVPDIVFASRTDTGRRRLANEDAFHSDTQLNLHVVCDGIGGQPSGEAASQIIAHTLGHMLRRRFKRLDKINDQLLRSIMIEAVVIISNQLHHHASRIQTLKGMGATIVAVLVEGNSAFILHAGDSRAYLLRGHELRQVTRDHTKQFRQYQNLTDTIEKEDAGDTERRLLMQYLGAPSLVEPHIEKVLLEAGDRILICTDGLTDPVDDRTIHHIISQPQDLQAICRNLIDAANAGGGPDNITTTLIEYRGQRKATKDDFKSPYPADPGGAPPGTASQFYNHLALIQHDLHDLQSHAQQCSDMTIVAACAAIKRWLGPELYGKFLAMSPTENPLHAFHRAFTLPESPWRKNYEQHMAQLQPVVELITAGQVRLSPMLHSFDTASIVNTLWKDWRRVEKLYFKVAQREPRNRHEQTVNILITHMLQSVNTLRGLLEFFPQFLRPKQAEEANV
ncbi:PP2C family protein-serine/threonine phosphatase [Poriferisphaera sp. WC338]|uniref:PP2C family protein-serine/threonine phosphatase n=1 Tax=Poriferisphaera sp. WC338 TaxID=3425129 RepID=UPI003D8159B7